MSESVEAAAPAGVDVTPVVPPADVTTPAVEAAPAPESAPAAGTAAEPAVGRPAFFQLLQDTLGDDKDDLDGFTDGLKPQHIKEFSSEARQTIKNLLRAFKGEGEARSAELTARESQLKQEAAEIDNRARGLHAQRAALLKLMQNPDIAKNAEVPEISDDDLMTPEGQKRYLEHLAAKNWKDSLAPLQETTQREAQALAYQKWAADKPEMRDERFKAGMIKLIADRKAINMSLSTADAYEIMKARASATQAETARARENAVRAASARQLSRGNGAAETPKSPPKKGGVAAIAQFVKENPDYNPRRHRRR